MQKASRAQRLWAVQWNAMKVWAAEGSFLNFLKAKEDVRAKLSDQEIEANFYLGYHLAHVDTIFTPVLGDS